jgi:ABC-type multidrug transport system fused ATPase/permease subunit
MCPGLTMRRYWNPFARQGVRRKEVEYARRRVRSRTKQKSDLLRVMREYIAPHWLRVTIGMTVNVLAAITPFAFGYANRLVVDDVLELGRWGVGGVNFSPEVLPEKTMLLFMIFLFISGVHLFSMVGGWVFNYSAVFVSQRIVFTMRKQLYEKLQELQLTFFDQRITGKIMSRVIDDVAAIEHQVMSTFSSIVPYFLMFCVGLAVIFSINVRLAFLALIVVPTWGIVFRAFKNKLKENQRRIREKNSEIYGVVEEKISAIRVVKAFATERREYKRYLRMASDYIRLVMRQARLRLSMSFFAGIISIFGTGLILYLGALEVQKGESTVANGVPMVDPLFLKYLGWQFANLGQEFIPGNSGEGITPGDLLYFTTSVGLLYNPVIVLTNLNAQIQWVMVVLRRVFEVLDEPVVIADPADGKEMPKVTGAVELRGVGLQYPNTTVNALSDLNLTIPAGSRVAIMGQSGAGKTTLVNLLLRFYEATEGEVMIDGIDVRDVTLKSLRRHISMVPQEITIFTGTIAENIKYGRADALHHEVIRAAKEAELHGFIMSLPEKYETEVGEHGTKLSGGQRQRLAMAMSLLTDPEVLILDDSTSALDAETEGKIRATLGQVMENRTSFIITHRIATAREADMIVVLDKGTIAEVGTHDELISRPGAYSRIVELQQRGASLIDDSEAA